jgi:hypothetical protein
MFSIADRESADPIRPQNVKALICACSLFLATGAHAVAEADLVKPLKEAITREELVNHFGTTVGIGAVEKWEFTTAGRELIVFGYCPYSGRAVCYVHAYYYQPTKQRWVLFIDRRVEPAIHLSAEFSSDHCLTFKDRDGKVMVKESIEALPR